jgi:hypothetical protein
MNKTAWLVALSLSSTLAMAAEPPVGYVKTVNGDAFVTTEGARRKAELGTAIFMGSVLQTGARSSLGVTFKDDTVMSFGPETQLTVDEFLYAPAQGKLKLSSRLTKGTLNYISGGIAKLKPDAVTVGTPTGTIGVRGTHFLVKIDDETAMAKATTR